MGHGEGSETGGLARRARRGRRLEIRGQRAEESGHRQLICHMASPSLGHYASLSFVVGRRGRRSETREKRVIG
jgi:hypothetical protein